MGRWQSTHQAGRAKYPPSAATGWSCSSASLGSGTARAPPDFRGGKTPPKPISEQLLSLTSQPFPPLATPHLGMKPGVNERNEASPCGQEGPPRPEAGSRPRADVQAHPDVGSWTARRRAGPPGRAPSDPTAEGCPEELSPSPPAQDVTQAEVTQHDKDGSPRGVSCHSRVRAVSQQLARGAGGRHSLCAWWSWPRWSPKGT